MENNIATDFILTNKSGLKLECRIDRDKTKSKQPIIFFAGGFGSDAMTGSTQPYLTDIFLKHGFAVMRMNFRGNGNSDGDLAFATITAGLEDLLAGLDYIKTLPWVEYVGLVGNSYGGGLAFHEVAENQNHKYKFLILLSPRIDTKWRYECDKDINLQDWEQKEFITMRGQKRHYSLYSDTFGYRPWEVAGNINIPTLIIHGDCDDTCPYEQSQRLHSLIKNSELKTIPGCEHQYKNRISEVGDFVDEWLKQF